MLNFRATDSDLRVLEQVRQAGESTTDVLRRALREVYAAQRRSQLRREAEALATQDDDLAEARAVREAMAGLRAW